VEGDTAIALSLPSGNNATLIRETEDGFHQYKKDKKRSSIQGTHVTYRTGKSHALSTAHIPMINEYTRIHPLTPIECERLQAYPDEWTAGVSDSQRYKTLGNAVRSTW
jgi:site-specific DNA-cytosine methylase